MTVQGSGLEITGLRETIRNLEKYGAEVSDLKAAFRTIGNIVVDEARSRAPKVSGALASSIRPSNTKNKSVVRVGSARVPYAGVIHFGWPRRHIQENQFLYSAAEAKQGQVLEALSRELEAIASSLGL
jgi:HK97 gp10 family phage protein